MINNHQSKNFCLYLLQKEYIEYNMLDHFFSNKYNIITFTFRLKRRLNDVIICKYIVTTPLSEIGEKLHFAVIKTI